MPRQLCFTGLKPPVPTIRTPCVALAVARRIVENVNLDQFYWASDEIAARIADVEAEIRRCGRPATVFCRLYRRQPLASCDGRRVTHPYGWEGIDEHCRAIVDDIAAEEVTAAVRRHKREYGD